MKAFMYMGYIKFDVSFPQSYPQFLWIKKMCYFYQMNQHNNWQSFIDYETKLSYFSDIKNRLISDNKKGRTILPDAKNYFKAFELCKLEDVKVVIIGQDPYHTPGVANGLAFSVDKNNPIPASLKNIYKEIKNDIGVILSKNGSLDSWASQGVLLLNSCLTVEVSKPGSHSGAGWENFIKEVVLLLNKKNNLVFLLWGKNAKKYKKYINPNSHLVLTAPHPSPLSAYRGFFGCKHFSKCNSYLKANGIVEINW